MAKQSQRGFTYIGLLVAVAVMGLMLTLVARVWRTSEERERETQLLWVGHAYRMAIASYFAAGHHFPATLQELVQDDRTPVPKHHLRRLYPDPMTGKADWSLVLTADGLGIMGVASNAKNSPIKRKGFELIDQTFADADCVCLWQFIYFPNRFTRGAVGLTSNGSGNAPSPPPKSVDSFKPGNISSLRTNGSALPSSSPFGSGGGSHPPPADPEDSN